MTKSARIHLLVCSLLLATCKLFWECKIKVTAAIYKIWSGLNSSVGHVPILLHLCLKEVFPTRPRGFPFSYHTTQPIHLPIIKDFHFIFALALTFHLISIPLYSSFLLYKKQKKQKKPQLNYVNIFLWIGPLEMRASLWRKMNLLPCDLVMEMCCFIKS